MSPLRRVALVVALCAGLFACAKPAWEQPPPPPVVGPIVPEGALHRGELDNGVEVMVLEDHRLPLASVGITVRRGSAIVEPESAGLAAFTAELMKRGAGSRGALELAEAVDRMGASLGVASDWDSMTVTVSGLSRDLDTLLAILADVVLRPRFDPGEAAKARSETLAGLERAKDDPATLARWHALATLYPGHRYGLPRNGTPETVARLDAAAARALHGRVFVPNDAIFAAAGDVDADDLLTRAGALFGAWQPGPVPDTSPLPPNPAPPARRIVIVDRPDLGQARIIIAHDGITRTDPERVAAHLMNTVLGGGGFSSRLTEKLRSEEGLTYGVSSGFSMRRHPGPFAVSTFTRVPEVRRALDLALAGVETMREVPPTDDELADAKALLSGRFALGLETSAAVANSLVDLMVYGLPEDALDTYRGRVRDVTTDDTARMAERLLHPGRAAIILVGPAEALVPQVEDLGPVEVVQP